MKKSEAEKQHPRQFDSIKIYDLPEFTPAVKPKGYRGKLRYNEQLCAFDIETTALPELQQSIMYIWQFAIEDYVIVGRTWEQFRVLVNWLNKVSHGRRIVCYVHNLSYEIAFLSGIFHFNDEDIFPVESRKVLKAVLGNIEFRCSYLLTNLSLAAFTDRYKVQHRKLSGEEFDYSKQRYPDTPLTDRELEYCVNDVLGLVEALHKLLDLNGDNVYTVPLTSTGFVRRICKDAMRPYHKQVMDCYPDYEVFKLLRKAFRGGNTHCNRYTADEVIRQPVTSMDIASSYPFQQVCKLFPVYPFEKVHSTDIHYVDKLIDRGRAVLFHVALMQVSLRNKYTAVPYIPLDKAVVCRSPVMDNGRVLAAEYIELVLTDIDWKIIVKQYQFKAVLVTAYRSSYGKLPDGLVESNREFYKLKTELKGVEGQELFYMKNKELLNSIYGMSVQSPVKHSILFNDTGSEAGLYVEDTTETDEELLTKSRKKAFTCYQFGVWTTAHARDSLEHGLDICGDSLLYCDTDSCKFTGQKDFSRYNEEMQQLAIAGGLVATDRKGVVHYGGVYELDGIYDAFISQGAKKYAYESRGSIHITVSGVGKKKGAAALTAAGGLDKFREGFVFHNCGKTESVYNDKPMGVVEYKGHKLNITRNVYIKEQDYTLSRSDEYSTIINLSKQDLAKITRHCKNMRA